MIIRYPWPARELNPNTRCHWAVKARAAKVYRQAGWVLTKASGFAVENKDAPIRISFKFCPPDNRRKRDLDNLLASCKALADGIADALGVNDERFAISLERGDVVANGCVEVTL